jgi:hypothetical protein
MCIILICIRIVIFGASPLRTASNCLNLTFQTLPELKKYTAPSPTTIKRWSQKLGYYKLNQPKAIANDWCVIVDASIQMGAQKCVLFLGCRLSNLPKNRALTLEDLEILSLRVVSSLNSKFITQELKNLQSGIGVIKCICSDKGPDMSRGIKDFLIENPDARWISDTAHKVANVLEATLEKSPRWIKFREQITQARRKMQNSLVAGALPPSPRIKARYMNVGSLIKWGLDMLILLDWGVSTSEFDIEELRKYLSWLLNYREEIYYWNRLVTIGSVARELVRLEGIHTDTPEHFDDALSSIKLGYRELQFADELSLFFLIQTMGMKNGERFLGSTEVLESLFGKLKFMEQEQTAFGFTSLVLAAIACVGASDEKTIRKAIISVRHSEICKWSKKEIGKSIQSQRRTVRQMIIKLINETGQNLSGNLREKVMGF